MLLGVLAPANSMDLLSSSLSFTASQAGNNWALAYLDEEIAGENR